MQSRYCKIHRVEWFIKINTLCAFSDLCEKVYIINHLSHVFARLNNGSDFYESEYIMSNYRTMAIRQRKWMLILLVLSAILAGILPQKHFFLGLLLGIGISFYNLWLLQRKTNLLGESAERDGSRKGIGTISRLAAAALGVLIAIRYDLSVVGFIIGLMTAYPIMVIDFIWFNRNDDSKEG